MVLNSVMVIMAVVSIMAVMEKIGCCGQNGKYELFDLAITF